MQRPSLEWFKGVQDEEQFEKTLRSAHVPLAKLRSILEDLERSLNNREASEQDFSDPNWSHKQAFRNGQKATIKKVKDLLSFIP